MVFPDNPSGKGTQIYGFSGHELKSAAKKKSQGIRKAVRYDIVLWFYPDIQEYGQVVAESSQVARAKIGTVQFVTKAAGVLH